MFKLISWNVNGLRSALGKGFAKFAAKSDADVICLQETKADPDQVDLSALSDRMAIWNPAEKKGYSGVVCLTRRMPRAVWTGMGAAEHDTEGRILTLEFDKFQLVNVYTPNSQRGLTRLDYRMVWDREFLAYLKRLEKRKPVVFCGDLNVAHTEIDLANPKANRRNAGFTDQERSGFSSILEAGFIDAFRELHPDEPGHYTWWTWRNHARKRNIGWRIDCFVTSAKLRKKIAAAEILCDVHGSDHCPVSLELDI